MTDAWDPMISPQARRATDEVESLDFQCVEGDDGEMLLSWNSYHPLAMEVLNHWTMDDWLGVLRDRAGTIIRLHGEEPTDLW